MPFQNTIVGEAQSWGHRIGWCVAKTRQGTT